jgi:GNAT superfamily N-acetyltransferase
MNQSMSKSISQIHLAQSDAEIARCFPVMQELRPHLLAPEFVERVRRQQQQGYQLLYLEAEGQPRAVAGFRLTENLFAGKFLYVDDLITTASDRSQGYGEALIHWLIDYARQQQCNSFQLDSGVQRSAAHRFYFRQRLEITSYRFSLDLFSLDL